MAVGIYAELRSDVVAGMPVRGPAQNQKTKPATKEASAMRSSLAARPWLLASPPKVAPCSVIQG